MSSSDPNSKIDFLDAPEVVRRKIKSAFCEEGNTAENGVLAFVEAVLIPISELRLERMRGETGADEREGEGADGDQTPFSGEGAPAGTVFSIFRKEEYGGSLHYTTYAQLKEDFAEKKLHPKDLKTAVADAIVRLLEPIQKAFESDEEWQAVEKLAYPDPNTKPEKKKKVCVWGLCRVGRDADACAIAFTAESVPPTTAGRSGQEQERACRWCRSRPSIRRREFAFSRGGCKAGELICTIG